MGFIGKGLFEGMAVTARNFIGSYFDKERLVTVQYPEERVTVPENSRTFPFLVFDDTFDKMRCTACKICEVECPPQCIYIIKSKDKKPDYKGQAQLYPLTFDIDISVCMSCQICVEVCPFESIKMNTEFELSTADRFGDLLLTKEKLSKSNSYYQKIHPVDAAESDAVIAAEKAKAEAKAKVAAEAKAKADAEAKAKTAAVAATAPIAPPANPPTTT